MRLTQLITNNLKYYWQTNLVVIIGVAAAVAVLAGALLVGDSVRGSLRGIFEGRLGETDYLVTSTNFFRDQLANEVADDPQFNAAGLQNTCPMIVVRGAVTQDSGGRLAANINVYGIDDRFWEFHRQPEKIHLNPGEAFISESLAGEMGVAAGDSILLRIEKVASIPLESIHGRKENIASTVRLKIGSVLSPSTLGDFSLQPQQSAVRTIFVSLQTLQSALNQTGRVNTILVAGDSESTIPSGSVTTALERLLQTKVRLDDAGIKLRWLATDRSISLETESKVIGEGLAQAADNTARQNSFVTAPLLSYLANRISANEKSIPYSLVTAVDKDTFEKLREASTGPSSDLPPIILNEWAARDLNVRPGETIVLDYYLWHEDGHLETTSAKFYLAHVVPIQGFAADRDLVPEYPGITESQSLADWDPPFPLDLGKVRKQDEDYWTEYRTTPKAFVTLEKGQELWQTRFGKLTSLRIRTPGEESSRSAEEFASKLRSALSLPELGVQVIPVRAQGLIASQGATDFGAYFLYFSFFLVISAILLAALFFRLGLEQRLRELGILRAIGFPSGALRAIYLVEGAGLAIAGSLIGVAGAVVYGKLMMVGLATWWQGAVGTSSLTLHVKPSTLLIGAIAGICAALVCVLLVLLRLGRITTRALLTGSAISGSLNQQSNRFLTGKAVAIASFVLGGLLLVTTLTGRLGQVVGFFGVGVSLLIGCLALQSIWLRRSRTKPIRDHGWWAIWRLGFRNTTNRPTRSVLCIALISSAAFILVAVDAFRRDQSITSGRQSGTGGFELAAESVLPLVHDPNSAAGREALNLINEHDTNALTGVTTARFRLKPGDDTSCLNLYQPQNPRIIAPVDDFIREGRFRFQNSVATTNEEQDNPWLLLHKKFPDGAIPVIADANSLQYVLHLKVGDDLILEQGVAMRLRVAGALADSIFQSELIVSEDNFVRLFPEQQGYRFFLIDTRDPGGNPQEVANLLEERLSDLGFDATSAAERLANFHRVENTYLSTFQILGGLGLILGTIGMAAVLLRNVFERRRELALLQAIGYNSSHFTLMVVAENALLVIAGLITGVGCALVAITPALLERGGRIADTSLVLLLVAVLVCGLVASLIATLAVLRSPLLPALRME